MKKFIGTLALALSVSAAVGAEEGHVTIADKPRPASEDPNHWWWKPLAYRENEVKEKSAADVVWLGDSITHYFDNPENQPLWRKWFGGKAAAVQATFEHRVKFSDGSQGFVDFGRPPSARARGRFLV